MIRFALLLLAAVAFAVAAVHIGLVWPVLLYVGLLLWVLSELFAGVGPAFGPGPARTVVVQKE